MMTAMPIMNQAMLATFLPLHSISNTQLQAVQANCSLQQAATTYLLWQPDR